MLGSPAGVRHNGDCIMVPLPQLTEHCRGQGNSDVASQEILINLSFSLDSSLPHSLSLLLLPHSLSLSLMHSLPHSLFLSHLAP